MQKTPVLKPDIAAMFQQSLAVISTPSVATFDRFEWRGGVQSAYLYVGLAALVSGVIAGFFAIFHQDVTLVGQLLSRLIGVLLGFAVFTGAVYGIGKALFKGTGTYPEVAYTFALFYVPLSIVGTVLGIIPILGWLVSFLITLVMGYFGFLAVQSSMNLKTNGEGVALLVLSALAYLLVTGVLYRMVA